jgi:putative phage-type endonuclease
MKVVDLKQNSKDWHTWRKKGIGASEAGAVLDVSPYTSPFELWGYKTGLVEKPPFNEFAVAAMKHGHDTEPEARAAYEKLTGIKMEPLTAEHSELPFIRASFDGINQPLERILEIKCTGKTAYQQIAKSKKVPKHYYAQIQQQLMVCGYKYCDFFVYFKDGKSEPQHVMILVEACQEYQIRLLGALKTMWEHIETLTPPPISKIDFKKFLRQVSDNSAKLTKQLEVLKLMEEGLQ